MASVATSWKLGHGIVTSSTALSGNASAVLYSGGVAWVLGGEGEYLFTNLKPKRPIPDDSFILHAAAAGTPCTLTISPEGVVALRVDGEDWGFTDC